MSSLSLQSPLVAIPLFTALSFLVVGSPLVFKFTDKKLSKFLRTDIASPAGVPTRAGLILHAIVIGLLMYAYLRAYSPEAALY